jgi:alkanesulfonate monooxygenase SsuD/methylene tetrahydromethanopterin reductase-like flavin-dependent oxidoreductase (luciferase family)
MLGAAGLPPPELGRAVEERGFDSLFWAEHTHIPVGSVRADGRPARPYADTFDPFVALSAAAAVTSRIKLGTGVCLVTERDPITLAKEVASLDRLSGGRFLFGVGAGWNRAEMADHGTDPRTRMALLADRIRPSGRSGPPRKPSTTASTSISARCGPGPSRCSDRTRRCWSAATGRARRTG